MPSDAQVEVVNAFFELAGRGDRAAADLVTDDSEARVSAFISGRRDYRGPAGVIEWLERVEEAEAEGSLITLRRRRLLGDRDDPDVICVIAQISIARDGGSYLENQSAYVVRMRGDRIQHIQGYLDAEEGVAALGDSYELG
jgi:ketosteroid isomerase-like protein